MFTNKTIDERVDELCMKSLLLFLKYVFIVMLGVCYAVAVMVTLYFLI